MKRIYKNYFFNTIRIGLIITTFGLCSCSDFLEKMPYDVVRENYYSTPEEVHSGLVGIYDVLGREQLYGGTYSSFLTLGDEGAYYRNTYIAGPEVYNYDAANATMVNLWRFLYQGIERANFFLSKVPHTVMDEEEKAAAIGEAKFLRAYYYFILVTNWGDVPLKTEPISSVNEVDAARTPQQEVYNFIVKEMTEADGMVRDIQEYGHAGRVTKSAVRGILARVYLKMAGAPLHDEGSYTKALEWAQKLVFPSGEQYTHQLVDDYTQIFKDMAADRYNIEESIWEAELYGNRAGDFEAGRIGNFGGVLNTNESDGYSYGFIAASRKLFELYESNDKRRDWNIANFYYQGNTSVNPKIFYTTEVESRHMAKYRREFETKLPKNKNYTPINFPLLRYSDVLLMFAEAENEVNGPTSRATMALKEVRDRANASDITSVLTSKEALRDSLRSERMRELCFEGLRKFDLVRYGTFLTEMKKTGQDYNTLAPNNLKYLALSFNNVSERDVLFPIPIGELTLNNLMTQNSGW